MQDEAHVFELLPAYALGALDDADAYLVASHLAACTVCRAELEGFQDVVDDLALPVPAETPALDSKHRMMDRVASLPAPRPAPRPPLLRRLMPAWGVVSLLIIIALAATIWQQGSQPAVFTGPLGMRAVALNNHADTAPRGSGIVIISADGQNGVLVVDALPELDAAQQYQVWLFHDDQATRGPSFTVDNTGYRGARIVAPDSLLSYTRILVTIEPVDGGGDPSTGEPVLSGSLHNPR